jgi:hypothetical protein
MSKDDKKSKAKPLTGLAAALVKSGHLKESEARDIAREQRKETKALGRDGVEQREAAQAAELEAKRKAEADAARERERQRVEKTTIERAYLVVQENRHAGGDGGPRRFFFITRERRVPFLEVQDEVSRMLADGVAGIVEACDGRVPSGHVVVVGEKNLQTLLTIDKEIVRFWNREGREPR